MCHFLSEVRVINPERVQTKVACQGETATLKCKNSSQAMLIYSAFYGREEKGRTLCPFIKSNVDQSVFDAKDTNDTSTCPEKNVTLEIMKLCHTRKLCEMTPNQNLFGNHCKGTYKILKIIYACGEYYSLPRHLGPVLARSLGILWSFLSRLFFNVLPSVCWYSGAQGWTQTKPTSLIIISW